MCLYMEIFYLMLLQSFQVLFLVLDGETQLQSTQDNIDVYHTHTHTHSERKQSRQSNKSNIVQINN